MYQHCSYTKTHCVILVVCGDILSLYFWRKVGSCFFILFYGWELTQTEFNTESVLHQQPLSSGKSSPVWLFLLWTPPLCWQPHIALKHSSHSWKQVVKNEVTAGFWGSDSSRSVLAALHILYLQNKKDGASFIYLRACFKKKIILFSSLLEWRQHGFCKSKFWKWNVERLFTFCSAL